MAIDLSILEKEDALKNLPDMALQQMLRQPSPNAPPFLVAAELKRREEMAKEFAGKQAAAQTAQQAPTVAHRLAGQQQPMPMSQAGAMAAPPQQPPMPQEAQLAMALSGATGRPPPELPTVNMQRGTTGAAMREMAKALRGEGTRSYAQRRGHQPFSSRERPPPVTPAGLALLLAAIQRQQSEPERAYGGFDISEDIRLPRGRGRTVAAARPVTAANGTQGRTVYAQFGLSDIAQDYQLLQSLRQPTWGADQYDSRGMAKEGSDLEKYNIFMDSVLDKYGGSKGYTEALRLAGIVDGDAAEPVSVDASNQAEFEQLKKEFRPANFDQLFPAQAILDDRTERPAMTDAEDTTGVLLGDASDFQYPPSLAAIEDAVRAVNASSSKQEGEARGWEGPALAGLRFGSRFEGTPMAGPHGPWPTPGSPPGSIGVPRSTEAEQYRQYGNMILADQAALAQTGEARGWEDFIIPTGGDAGVAQRVYEQQQEEAGYQEQERLYQERMAREAANLAGGFQAEENRYRAPLPVQPAMSNQPVGSSVVPVLSNQPAVSKVNLGRPLSAFNLSNVAPDQQPVASVDNRPAVDNRSAAQVWWDDWQARSRAQSKEARDLRGRRDFLDRFRSDIGRPGSVLGWFTRTPQERQQGLLVQQEFESVRPLLESDPVLFDRFGEDPQAFIEDRLAQKAAAKTMLSKDVVGPTVLAEKSVPVDGVTAESVTETVTETVTEKAKPSRREEAAALAQWPTNISPTGPDDKVLVGGEDKGSFQRTSAALRGRLTALEDQKADDITGQATQFFNTLTEANKDVYSNLEDGLKEFRKADAKDFEKLEARFKALDDFYETGKLPERMRQDRITNLMLEMSKGLLGNQDLYSGFKAGLEGFQAVDKAARDEYAKGLAARLTASKGIIDSKMAMRNSRRQEAIAMTKFAAAENRGNAALAMEQLKIAQQAKQNERTHQINLIRGEATILSADASMAAAMKGTKEERLLKSLPRDMYAGALAKAKDGNRTELDTYYRRDSQGNVHANMPAFIALVNKLGSTGYGAIQSASYFDRAKRQFQSDVATSVKALKGEWTKTNAPQWAAIARSIGLTPPTGPLEFDKIRDRLVPAAEKFYAAKIATQIQHATPGMPDWIARTYGLGGAAQGRVPTKSLEELTTLKTESE